MSRQATSYAAASYGCYEAARAAALSGVPARTVYDWAQKGVVVPTVSPVQEKLWSYADLMALRILAWLRRPKGLSEHGGSLPASPMRLVREALARLDHLGMNIWDQDADRTPLVVDQRGDIFIEHVGSYVDLRGDRALPHEDRFGLLGPFQTQGHRGPDLLRPRPHLRIVPDRVAGEPHACGTRITTRALAGMSARGFEPERIAGLYDIDAKVVLEAIDLERSLGAA